MVFPRKATKRFTAAVPPGESETLTESIDYNATVEHCTVRFYPGQELTLRVDPFRERNGDRVSLIDYLGQEYVTGDDDFFEFDVSESVQSDDVIGVEFTNNGSYEYQAVCHITVDQAGGTGRLVSKLRGMD